MIGCQIYQPPMSFSTLQTTLEVCIYFLCISMCNLQNTLNFVCVIAASFSSHVTNQTTITIIVLSARSGSVVDWSRDPATVRQCSGRGRPCLTAAY